MTRVCPYGVGAMLLVAGTAHAASRERVAMVRLVSPHAAPPGWLELEEQIAAALAADSDVLAASRQAEAVGGPGVRWDRARTRLAAALDGAEAALAAGEADVARESLAECDDLLSLAGVVAVSTAATLRRCHRLRALVEESRGGAAAERAWRQYAALLEVRVQDDKDLPQATTLRVERELADAQPGGLSVDVGDGDEAVYIDGVLVGRGEQRRYDLRPGRHYLRVVGGGRAAYGERINVSPGEIVRRRVQLDAVRDPLPERGEALFAANVAAPQAQSLNKLAAEAGAGRVVLLMASPGGAAVRVFDADGATFGPMTSVSLDAGEPAIRRALARARGAESAEIEMIEATAIPSGALTPPAATETREEKSGSRWLWLGGGALAVAAVVTGIVLAAQSGGESEKVGVWLCPAGAACAP